MCTPLDDAGSFEVVFSENFPAVHRFLARRVGTVLADDLAAETFAIAYRRRGSYDPSRGAVGAWLFGIATRLLRAHWRKERQLLALEARLASEPPVPFLAPEEAVLAAWLAPRLASALARLSRDQRDVLLLHAWAELSSEEIAGALEISAATARSRLSRARAQLRQDLGGNDLDVGLLEERSEPLLKECET
jgi:RNA polymerase sigma-70 factor (ECF subfamily)